MLPQFPQKIFMLGLAGAGMQALAQLLHAHGHTILGTDADLAKLATIPTLAEFTVCPEDRAAALIDQTQLLIYTDAAPVSHPARRYAQAKKIPEQMLFTAVGELAKNYRTLAVTGTHGKSSTTAFLGHIFATAGLDPTVQLGAGVATWPLGNARVGTGDYFIVEADEYRRHFLSLTPAHAIITTIDFDHPDFFQDITAVEDAYRAFMHRVAPGGTIVAPADVITAHPQLPWPTTTISVPPPVTPLPVTLPGRHMQLNAALAVVLAQKVGVDATAATQALASFPGLARRFEIIGQIDRLTVISDYGHHPTEIAATLHAARAWRPQAKILAIIEPHTAARVTKFTPQFVAALTTEHCDGVLVYPTFYVSGRDDAAAAVHSGQQLYEALHAARPAVARVADREALHQALQQQATQYDIAIAFTAGVLDSTLRSIVTIPTP